MLSFVVNVDSSFCPQICTPLTKRIAACPATRRAELGVEPQSDHEVPPELVPAEQPRQE